MRDTPLSPFRFTSLSLCSDGNIWHSPSLKNRSLPFYDTHRSPPLPFFIVRKSYVLCSNRGNKDISKLSLLAVSLQDTSDAMGVTEVRQSCTRLREVIRVWSEAERRAGGAVVSLDGVIAEHGRLKSDFALAKSWLTRYVETGNVPSDDGVTCGGAATAAGVVAI